MNVEGFATAAQIIPVLALIVAIEGRAAPQSTVRILLGIGKGIDPREPRAATARKVLGWIWGIGVAALLLTAFVAEVLAIVGAFGGDVGEVGMAWIGTGLVALGLLAVFALGVIMWDWMMGLGSETPS